MALRYHCKKCDTVFVLHTFFHKGPVRCPKCGARRNKMFGNKPYYKIEFVEELAPDPSAFVKGG
jgi:uncharacterized Zn finger protein (UPF0148 family)